MTTATTTALHELPLVRQMLDDEGVRFVRRPIDQRWRYERRVGGSAGGFNPYRFEIQVPQQSALALFLDGGTDLRELNRGDFLLHELMFAVHDHLHAWAVAMIRDLAPDLGFGEAPLTAENLEAHAFCHLLTEAVATVGLDYWDLAGRHLGDDLDLGSPFVTLTSSYHEDHREEFARWCPELTVQSPGFFGLMARFYCTGRFPGTDREALGRSPRLLHWLEHELLYGVTQRRYTRQWLHHLGGLTAPVSDADLGEPVACDAEWQESLVDALGERLWEKVKLDRARPIGARPAFSAWAAPTDGPLDFRFTAASALDAPFDAIRERGMVPASFGALFDQVVSQVDGWTAPSTFVASLPALRKAASVALLEHCTQGLTRLTADGPHPPDLFLLA